MGKLKTVIKPYLMNIVYYSKKWLDEYPLLKDGIISAISSFPYVREKLYNLNMAKKNMINGIENIDYKPYFNDRALEIYSRIKR